MTFLEIYLMSTYFISRQYSSGQNIICPDNQMSMTAPSISHTGKTFTRIFRRLDALLYLAIILSVSACSQSKQDNNILNDVDTAHSIPTEQDSLMERINYYWDEYDRWFAYGEEAEAETYLDSALTAIDEHIHKHGVSETLIFDKEQILITLKRFEEAYKFFKETSPMLFSGFPKNYRDIMLLRIGNFKNNEAGDTIAERKCYRDILRLAEEDFSIVKDRITPYFESFGKEKSKDDTVWIVLIQYIGYTHMSEGRKAAEARLENLYERHPKAKKMDDILRLLAEEGFDKHTFEGY